jgi:hypothetical protein
MTVNHGVPGSSPGEGAKEKTKVFSFFLDLGEKFIQSLLKEAQEREQKEAVSKVMFCHVEG